MDKNPKQLPNKILQAADSMDVIHAAAARIESEVQGQLDLLDERFNRKRDPEIDSELRSYMAHLVHNIADSIKPDDGGIPHDKTSSR